MNKIKVGVVLIVLMLIVVAFPGRYLSAEGGVLTANTDLAVHINISESLALGDIFPNINQTDLGIHAVSKYLPLYHGLLGFHALAGFFSFLGLPLPGAYGLSMDMSVVIVILVGIFLVLDRIKTSWKWDYLAALAIFIPTYFNLFFLSTNEGFYSQLLSQALICIAVYLYQNGNKHIAAGFFTYAVFSYPDFLIWFIPLFLFQKYRYALILKPFLVVSLMVLILVPLARSKLGGPSIASLAPTFSIYVITAFFGYRLWKKNQNLAVVSISFCIGSLVLLVGGMNFLNPSYYAVKISSFSYLLLPYLIVQLEMLSSFKGRLVFAVVGLLIVQSPDLWSPGGLKYFTGKAQFTNADFLMAKKAKSEIESMGTWAGCFDESTYLVMDTYSKSYLRTSAANAVLRNFDIYSLDLKYTKAHERFNVSSGSAPSFFQMISDLNRQGWIAQLADDNIICLAFQNSLVLNVDKNRNLKEIYKGEDFVYFKLEKN